MRKYYIVSLIVAGLILAVGASASVTSGTLQAGLSSGLQGVVIVPPTASPIAGAYTALQNVVLSAEDATSIHYTFDGTAPSCESQTYYTGVPIPVGQSLTIKALSCYANNIHSSVASFVYIINISTGGGGGGNTGGGGSGGGGGGTSPVTPIVGDIDDSGKVDIIDFADMMANWGKTGANTSDLNGDSVVDIIDFALLMAHWSV